MRRKFKAEELNIAAAKVELPISVFLAGPWIDPNAQKPRATKKNSAARLRYELFQRISHFLNEEPVLGEHSDLIQAYKNNFGTEYDTASNEMMHIINKSDCIIIIPSSPGSFSELGMFVTNDSNNRKMLILLDVTKKDPPGYVHVGPAALAEIEGAKVLNVDYKEYDDIWAVVELFLEKTRNRKLKNQLLGRA